VGKIVVGCLKRRVEAKKTFWEKLEPLLKTRTKRGQLVNFGQGGKGAVPTTKILHGGNWAGKVRQGEGIPEGGGAGLGDQPPLAAGEYSEPTKISNEQARRTCVDVWGDARKITGVGVSLTDLKHVGEAAGGGKRGIKRKVGTGVPHGENFGEVL